MLNGLDLFSGYGGISLGLSEYVRPIAYCEKERYCQFIILSRQLEGRLPKGPIWDNVRTLDGSQFKGQIDIVYGGFPCQDISTAGNGEGLEGKRSGLFYELCRVVQEIEPSFVFLENVPAIRTRGLSQVANELTKMGYGCRWTVISASSLGAPHKRERWFLLAHTMRERLERQREKPGEPKKKIKAFSSHSGWETEPNVARVDNGTAYRVDRIKSLGNGVVPQQVKKAFEILMGIKDKKGKVKHADL